MRITVLSTFDIWPPRDGGQFRYSELWTKFSSRHEITIVAYEFRNLVSDRRYRLAGNVEVVVPRASDGDARHFAHMLERTGLWLQDILCLVDYRFSDEFLRTLAGIVSSSDVVVASHPYLAHVAYPFARRDALRVYESYNVEYDIKDRYLHTSAAKNETARLLAQVRQGERCAAQQAHHVTAVSANDRSRLIELYDLDERQVSVVPNGVNVRDSRVLSPAERDDVRRRLKLHPGLVGIFIGSVYSANVESYRRGRLLLEEAGFRGSMFLVGSINTAPRTDWPEVGFDERWFGFVDDDEKLLLLESADFALQLIYDGAGTNLKLFDYMAAELPIIANAFGSRGVEEEDWFLPVETAADLATTLAALAERPEEAARVAERARRIARERFDWRAIAGDFEARMERGFPAAVD